LSPLPNVYTTFMPLDYLKKTHSCNCCQKFFLACGYLSIQSILALTFSLIVKKCRVLVCLYPTL
jgi:hypothetical protein